jgi:putative transposase
VIRWAGRAIAAWAKPRADLIAENLCLRQQLIVLQRRVPRPRLRDGDRRFWILVCRSFLTWRDSLLVIQLNTVLRWHRRGWTAYWRWRSRPRTRGGRPPLPRALRALIRRMAVENRLWGQRRVQAELARLGFPVSARTVAKYMRRPYDGVPSPTWRKFLTRHAKDIWACDFRCADGLLQDAVRLLRDAPRNSADPAGAGDPTSHRRLDGSAGRGHLCLGSGSAAVSHP